MLKTLKKSRHVRWNWEKSPDNPEMARYHFVIIDDKDRKGKVMKIIDTIKSRVASNYPFEQIRSVEGKVKGTEFRYLFESYDSLYSPSLFCMDCIFKKNVRDTNLYERKKGNIEDYVSNLYG
jgi:hypothetical protein